MAKRRTQLSTDGLTGKNRQAGSGSASRQSGSSGRGAADESVCHLEYVEAGLIMNVVLKGRGVTRIGRSYRADGRIDKPGMPTFCLELRKRGKTYVLQNISRQYTVTVNRTAVPFGKYLNVGPGDEITVPGLVKLKVVGGCPRPLVDLSYQEFVAAVQAAG